MLGCASAPEPKLEREPMRGAVMRAPLVDFTAPPNVPRSREPADLYVRCADAASCPSAVGMLVVEREAEEPERCTASLIAPDRALTASHCLAASDRHAGAACASTWIAFPETRDAAAEWIACASVLYAAAVDEDALHQEHAVLQLARPVARAPLAIDASPPAPGSIVTVVSVTPHPIYASTHALATRLCRAIDSEPAERELGASAANVGWLARCPIARGNSGSPVLDYEGRIRAIVHGGTSVTSAFGVTSGLTR